MGCGATTSKPAAPEQQDEMCCWTSKDVVIVCLQHVLNENVKEKNLQIQAPSSEMATFRKMPEPLRVAAEELQKKTAAGGEAAADAAKGVLGSEGVLGKAAGFLGSLASGATGAVGDAGSAVLTGIADQIDKLAQKVDNEFATVAGDVAAEKVPEIIEAYNKVLKDAEFKDGLKLCRGAEPYGPDEYDKCAPDNITKAFMAVAGDKIEPYLLEAVGGAIENNRLVNTWKSANEQMNLADGELNKLTGCKREGSAVKLDLKKYIVTEIIKKIAELMGVREGAVRKEPADKCSNEKCQPTFSLCLSGRPILVGDYRAFNKAKS